MKTTKHLIIPDCQIRPGVTTRFLPWVGNYIYDKRPDTIICLGDFNDMPSLSSYDVGKAAAEGKRYVRDIEYGIEAMALLMKPFRSIKRNKKGEITSMPKRGYNPRLIFTMGNHEERIDREVEANPRLIGTLSTDNLQYKEFGWEVVPFLKIARVDQIEYTHYFTSGVRGNPVGKAVSILNARHNSGVMGHVQTTDIAFHPKTGHLAIMAGVCNLHDEKYLSHQDNVYRRQIVVLHEIHNGKADPMFVSLNFLARKYT